MRDRLSTKILSNGATRYGVYDETGNLLRYEYIKLEDEPTVEGDLFSKANMLPDSIPAALGLKMGNPQVKDALNVLANIGNVHVWERVQTYAEPVPEVPAGYTLGNVETNVVISSGGTTTIGWITDPSTITVEYDGTVVFPSNSSGSTKNVSDWAKYSYYSDMQGKYCHVSQEAGTHVDGITFFFPSNASLSNVSGTGLVASKLQRVIGYPYTPAIPAGTTTDYLTSTDRNAYPDQSAEGGQDAYYTLGDVVIGSFVSGGQKDETYGTWSYGSELSVSSDGALSLSGTTGTVSTGYGSGSISSVITELSVLKGKFAQLTTNRSGLTIPTGVILFIPTDMTITNELYGDGVKNKVIFDKYQPVTGHAAIPANTTITYLGQLGGRARIEVGSYVGTGTYGNSNPNSLTFGIEPKFVLLMASISTGGNYIYCLHMVYGADFASTYAGDGNDRGCRVTWGDKSVTWHSNNDATSQLNSSGKTTYYIAIG